jgi:hypothetical protein
MSPHDQIQPSSQTYAADNEKDVHADHTEQSHAVHSMFANAAIATGQCYLTE